MNVLRYAPSAKFVVLIFSLAISAGLVYGAERFTHTSRSTSTLTTSGNTQNSDREQWEATLASIQAQNADTLFEEPDPNALTNLLQAATQGNNVTDAVGRTLFINLSSAKSQGLGDDIPTQEKILEAASAQLKAKNTTVYTAASLTIKDDSDASFKAYGNGVMQILSAHQEASEQATLLALDSVVNNIDVSQIQKLPKIAAAYQAIERELLSLPVPKTLSPLHLSVVNGFSVIVNSYSDMKEAQNDPLRAVVGLQTYETELTKVAKVFTSIAQSLNKNGILFTKDEPGSAWKGFLTSP
jgi:hypothetical protein